MSGEMKVNRWRLPLVVGSVVVLVAAIAVGVGTLIAHDQNAKTTPAAFASQSPSPVAVLSDDPHGQKACELNKEAAEADRLSEDATLLRILNEGKQSTSFDIRFASQMLYDSQTLSNAAEKSNSGDLENLLAGQKASIEMQTACVKAGLL